MKLLRNQPLHPIAACWAAPGELVVRWENDDKVWTVGDDFEIQ